MHGRRGRAQTGGTLANGLVASAYSQSARAPRPGPAVISASVPRGAAPTSPGASTAATYPSIPVFSLTATHSAQQPSVLRLSCGARRRSSERVPRIPVQPAPVGAKRKLPQPAGAGGGSGARMGARVGGGGAHGR